VIDGHDLTDSEWALQEPLLPDRAVARRGGQWLDHRVVIDAVVWRTRTGSPWRDLPGEFGNGKTVSMRHRRWSRDGTWQRVLDELRPGCDQAEGADLTVGVDSRAERTSGRGADRPHSQNSLLGHPADPGLPKK
jgi:transposase